MFVLSSSVTKQIKESLEDTDIKDIIAKPWWSLSQDIFVQGNWRLIFKHIKQAKCLQLWVCSNRHPKIISDISRPVYTQLKILNLQFNKINSIESVSFLHMESLTMLHLGNNQITQTKPLNKAKFQSLQKLDLSENQLPLIEISRLKYGFDKVELRIGNNHFRLQSNEQMNWMARLNFDKIIWRKQQLLQIQIKVITILKRKIKEIIIF